MGYFKDLFPVLKLDNSKILIYYFTFYVIFHFKLTGSIEIQ